MMKRSLSLLVAFLAVSLVQAQERVQERPQVQTGGRTTAVATHKLSTIMNSNVVLQKESLGKVVDVVINDGGCIDYLIVSYNNEYLAVPWAVVNVDARQEAIVITNTQITREQLRNVTFTRDRWPNFTDATWTRNMQQVWGEAAFRGDAGGIRPGVQPGVQPGTRPGVQPGVQPGTRPGVQPGVQPGTTPRPGTTTPQQPGTRPGTPQQPDVQPRTIPQQQPNTRPNVQPDATPRPNIQQPDRNQLNNERPNINQNQQRDTQPEQR